VGQTPQKLTALFCENLLFCYGFKNGIAAFAFIAVGEKSIWRQKSGRANNNATDALTNGLNSPSMLWNI